ncbi:MAG: fibronectin type III domain-containing protein, partial [Flavobacteriaceae bacterium]
MKSLIHIIFVAIPVFLLGCKSFFVPFQRRKFQAACLFLFMTFFGSYAQNHPVQVIPQAVPPAPIYLSNYADATAINGPLRVQLVLNDITIANREVRLKAYFEGNGIAFQSHDLVTGASPLFLEGGIPLTLTNTELAPYFRFENITGISPTLYGKPIPEGMYQFCFEVYDVLTNSRLSSRSCVTTVVFQNDPPILIAPQNKSIVENRNPQNIVFQWTPRHINVSNVEYELTLVEIWDNHVDPQAAFLSSQPIFQTTTLATTYLYGPADPLLLPDKNYAWRVQAVAKQGTEEIGLFKNQGYSEIFYFGNTGNCDIPTGVSHEVKGSTNANILWNDFSLDTPEYVVRYRQKGTNGAWFHAKTTSDMVTLWDLKAGTEYEYQVSKACLLTESDHSPLQSFRTHLFDDDDSTYECGISPDINVSNQVPLENLQVGEKFTAGDFPVTVLEVNGSNGYFNGKGYVTIPYLKSIKVAVQFTNVFINQNKELAKGNVITLYDSSLSGIIDPWDFFDDVGDIVHGGDHTTLDAVPFEIERAEISEDKNEITFHGTDENGNPTSATYPYDEADTYTIQGGDTMYSVDENGNLNELGPAAEGGAVTEANTSGVQEGREGTADDPAVITLDNSLVEITYLEDTSASYGWDAVNSAHEESTYHKVALKNGGSFYPIHKAVKNGASDSFMIDVTIKSDAISLDQLVFKTMNGLAIETSPVSGHPNRLKVTVKGSTGYRSEEAVVTVKESEERQVVVSSFFIHHLRPLSKVNVTLVPVNGAAIDPSMKSAIASKFARGGGNLNVIDGAGYTGNTTELQYTESGLLSKHPESFANFHSDFKTNYDAYSNESYYVFVFDNTVQPGNNLAGFMPRGSQFGFVFPSNIGANGLESKQNLEDVMAHEIGHGVFGLTHPFESGTSGKGTDWLMDYGNGNALSKADWEAMGDKGLQLYLFDDDGDGSDVVVINIEELEGWEYNGVAYAFLSPSGEVVLLPKKVKKLVFSTGDRLNTGDEDDLRITPFGTLLSFSIDRKEFRSCWNKYGNTAEEYKTICEDTNAEVYRATDYLSVNEMNEPLSHVIAGTPYFKDGGLLFKAYHIENRYTDIEEIKREEYTTRGPIQEFDFIAKDLTENRDSRLLSAPPSFEINRASVDFVQYYIENKNFKGEDAYQVYLYTHATLLHRYNLLNSCFETGLPGEFLRNIKAYSKFSSQPYVYDGFYIPFPKDFELVDNKKAFSYLMSRWGEVDINYYKELKNLIEETQKLQIPSEVTNSNIELVIDMFKEYLELDDRTDNFDCVFSELTTDNKRNILKLLLSNDKDDFLRSKYERLLVKILETLKEEDLTSVFEDLKSDPKFIYNGYHKLDEWFNGKYMDAFIYALLANWQTTGLNFDFASAYPELAQINSDSITEENYRTLINHEKVFILEDEKLFTGTPSDLSIETKWNSTSKQLRVFQDKDVLNSYGKAIVGRPLSSIIEAVFDPDGPNKLMEDLHPLDPVLIYISEQEAKDLKIQLQPGIYAVPAVLLHWVYENQQSEVAAFYTRIALNGVAILLAPFTGGGSTALITLEIGLAATDTFLTITSAQLGMSHKNFQKLYKYWDNLYTVYGVTLAGAGLFKAGPNIVKESAQLIANAGQAKGVLNIEKLKNLGAFRNMGRDEFHTKIRELAHEMDKMGEAMLKTGKVKWSNYGHELKRFALSIRLNIELKYSLEFGDLVGQVNAQNKVLFSNGGSSSAVFGYSYNNKVHDLSDIRYLKNFTNVYNVKFAGQIDNVRYYDNGEELQRIILVEDADNPNSFFALTEKDIDQGIPHVANFNLVRNAYRGFNGLSNANVYRGVKKGYFKESVEDFTGDQNLLNTAWD